MSDYVFPVTLGSKVFVLDKGVPINTNTRMVLNTNLPKDEFMNIMKEVYDNGGTCKLKDKSDIYQMCPCSDCLVRRTCERGLYVADS